MKKWMLAVIAGILIVGLAACSDTAEPQPGTDESKESELTAEEVYNKALESSNKMESAAITMKMDQDISGEGKNSNVIVKSKFDMKMTMDPYAFHQKGTSTVNVAGMENGQEMPVEMYMNEDGLFVNDGMSGQWVKLDNSMTDAINAMSAKQQDPAQQLKMLKDYTEDLKFEQTNDAFILKLAANGDKFSKLVNEMMKESMPPEMSQAMGEEGQEILQNMEVNKMNYEMRVDKETFQLNAFTMDMDMKMKVEGNEMNMAQKIKADYSKINEIKAITIPQEIKDKAVEQSQFQ